MKAIKKKYPELAENMILHHDNAPCHRSARTLDVLDEMGMEILPHSPYSPDLAPCDFHIFPAVKHELRGQHHEDLEDLCLSVQHQLNILGRQGFEDVYARWVSRHQKCVDMKGEYFEK